MMTLTAARKHHIDEYVKLGAKLVRDDATIVLSHNEHAYHILQEDIEEFVKLQSKVEECSILPNECSLASPTYREQAIAILGDSRIHRMREVEYDFGVVGNGISASVGPATREFFHKMRFIEGFQKLHARQFELGYCLWNEEISKDKRDIRKLYSPAITIKIFGLAEGSTAASIGRSHQIINDVLFQLAYERGVCYEIRDAWDRQRHSRGDFTLRESSEGKAISFPRAKVDVDLSKLYLRGTSTQDPIVRFLSYYQVLEFFFLRVADESLYQRLAARIKDPQFGPSPAHLDRLIASVQEHRKVTDEKEMLRSVLKKYVPEEDVARFILAHEKSLGENWYTGERTLVGEKSKIPLDSNMLTAVAQRIKNTRNAIVHSSDRYERKDRSVVHSREALQSIGKEIPLLRFLAEQVIIAAADSY